MIRRLTVREEASLPECEHCRRTVCRAISLVGDQFTSHCVLASRDRSSFRAGTGLSAIGREVRTSKLDREAV
jgi:hypothetical protein